MRELLLLIVIALGLLGSCSDGDRNVSREGENLEEPKVQSPETKSIEGVLESFPQDVKSEEAWLGHEYRVGETPIRPTEAVPSEMLSGMVGTRVKIEGVWNPGEKWEAPKPTEEGFYEQQPVYPEGATVIRGSGIEASSVLKVEK